MSAATAQPISRADLESKMRELQSEVVGAREQATSYVLAAGAVALVVAVGAAYFFGRRRGKKRSTVVEVRRL